MVRSYAMVQTVVRGMRPNMGQVVSPRLPLADIYIILRPSTEVNVRLWDLGEYQERLADSPPLIDPDWIKGHLAISTVSIGHNRTKVWATVDLVKVRILHMTNDLSHDLCLQ